MQCSSPPFDRIAKQLPVSPPPEGAEAPSEKESIYEKRAGALALLCSAHIAEDQDPDRATVVVHAPLETLTRALPVGKR